MLPLFLPTLALRRPSFPISLGPQAAGEDDIVTMAEELREAVQQLGCITGEVGFEEILDVVFGDFCIGK